MSDYWDRMFGFLNRETPMIYRGYALYPTPNDPGVVIRSLPPPQLTTGPIVATAPTYFEGTQWIDQQIDGPPVRK